MPLIWLHLVGCAFYAMAAVAGVRGIFSPAKNIEPMGRVAKMIIFCGWVAQTAYIIGLGVREGRHPWNSPHEVLLFFVWALTQAINKKPPLSPCSSAGSITREGTPGRAGRDR